MAPMRPKKTARESSESATSSSSVDIQSFPAPPQIIAIKTRSPVRTPSQRSPIRKATKGITLRQKQALIDNLQLEITDRARKLRAQYMLQAQGLQSRIEIRINRIPNALRKANMGALYQKYDQGTSKASTKSPQRMKQASPAKVQQIQDRSRASPSPQRPCKRHSDEISSGDKENEGVDNPKKRSRGTPVPPTRTTSKLQAQVLSPRSANSRSIARSPVVRAQSSKSNLARPISPLKPTAPTPVGGAAGILTNMVEKAKSTRGVAATKKATAPAKPVGAGRGRRAAATSSAPAPKGGRGRASTLSDQSDSSNGTIVRKPGLTKMETAAKRTVMETIKGIGGGTAGKKVQAGKAATSATGTRVLRKRN